MSTPTITHPVVPEELMALLDGELPADRSQFVSAHTESCGPCGSTLQELRRVRQNIAVWQISPVPPSVEARVGATGARSSRTRENASPGKGRWSAKQRAIGLGLAAAALLFLVLADAPISYRAKFAKSKAVIAREQVEQFDSLLSETGKSKTQQSQAQPLNGRSPSLDRLATLQQPGIAADSNGVLHGFGDHVANSFSLDGQPLSDQQARVFSGPMIARTVSLAILVKDFDVSRKSLDTILLRYQGYSASLTVNTPQGAPRSLQGTLRIPAGQLLTALAELRGLGHVENESQNGEEVTQQHADLVVRLKNSRETEQRLQAVLNQRTGNMSEVLQVEREIARVRGEIEQMEAEQQNLEHRVDFAAVDLNLSEEYKAKLDSAVPSFSTRMHNSLVDGYRNVADTVVALVLFFAEYTPILLFWAVLLLLPARLLWRRYRSLVVTS
jgi:hypothetical protein